MPNGAKPWTVQSVVYMVFRKWKKDVGEIKQALRLGLGSLVDEEGIDWWDLLAPIHYQ